MESVTPRRWQRSRRVSHATPDGSVFVGAPSKWRNPFTLASLRPDFDGVVKTATDLRALAVEEFTSAYLRGDLPFDRDEIRAELAGRDVVCWCRLDQPCHGDVLLEIANRP